MNRRQFLIASAVASTLGGSLRGASPKRLMSLCLYPGSVGVHVQPLELIDLASRHGFETIEAEGEFLSRANSQQLADVKQRLNDGAIRYGGASLPRSVNIKGSESEFREGLKALPKIASVLQDFGVNRMNTWISPSSKSVTYLQNLRLHAKRLREVTRVLGDYGLLLGLEYIGTQSLLLGGRYPFIHTFAELRDLIGEVGAKNLGFVLDSWHWWTAGDSAEDILTLNNRDIALVDLNDAPLNTPKSEVRDNRRELPAATGRIDTNSFIQALLKIGYDGPVRAEPFNQTLDAMDNEEACATTIKTLKKAFQRATDQQ